MTRSISIAGALALAERGVYVVHDPHTRRVSGALEPERHVFPADDGLGSPPYEPRDVANYYRPDLARDADPFAAVVDSGYSPADDERDFEEEAWQRRDREEEALAELEGEFGDEVRAVVESRRIAESDPSQRHGFSRRVASLAAVALAALAVAMPATASSTSDDPCAKVYPPVETIAVGPRGFKRLVPAHPIMVAYVKCLRTVRPVGAPDRP